MKKSVKLLIISILCFILSLTPTIAVLAESGVEKTDWEDIILSEEEYNELFSNNLNQTYASGLIVSYSLGINYSDGKLVIGGTTMGNADVVKCGFKKVVIQRRASSSDSWSDYLTYNSLYSDSNMYVLGKSITVPSGYYYRVTAVHYAKKNILSTQKINNTSNTVYI